MGTHPIFESDFDCLTVQRQKLQKLKKDVRSQGKETLCPKVRSMPHVYRRRQAYAGAKSVWFDWSHRRSNSRLCLLRCQQRLWHRLDRGSRQPILGQSEKDDSWHQNGLRRTQEEGRSQESGRFPVDLPIETQPNYLLHWFTSDSIPTKKLGYYKTTTLLLYFPVYTTRICAFRSYLHPSTVFYRSLYFSSKKKEKKKNPYKKKKKKKKKKKS